MFDLDAFIADCVSARAERNAVVAVKEVVDRALAEPGRVAEALPSEVAEFKPLYVSPAISILKFVWGPSMAVPPHDHLMWAVIGIYGGEEDNVFYRRMGHTIVEVGGRRVSAAQSAMLGADVIHAVTNSSRRACTGSIHIYGGDYLHKSRSMWDPDNYDERAADGETVRRLFDEARAQAGENPRP